MLHGGQGPASFLLPFRVEGMEMEGTARGSDELTWGSASNWDEVEEGNRYPFEEKRKGNSWWRV